MGTNDLAKETGAALVEGRAPINGFELDRAGRQYELAVLDGVYIDINSDGLAAECRRC